MTGDQILILVLAGFLILAILEIVYTRMKHNAMKRDLQQAREMLSMHWEDFERCFENIRANVQAIEQVLDGGRLRHVGRAIQGWSGEVLAERGVSEVPRENLRIGDSSKSKWFDRN